MLIADLRYAVRSLLRARGFALAVVVTLGLGIGATTAIFSVIRGVMLKPLPHREGDRLMYLRQSISGPGGDDIFFSVPEIEDFRNGSHTLAGIAEYSPITFTLVGDDDAERIDVGLVTGNYFSVMGLAPVLGRSFTDDDDGRSAAPVMMLTYDYWQSRFGGDPSVVGSTLHVAGHAVTVVGVLQPAPFYPAHIDALMNMVNSEHHLSAMMVTGRTHRMTAMIARLAPGVSVEQARAEVGAITARAHAEHPEAYDPGSGFQVTVTPFHEILGQRGRLTMWLLMGAAAFVLIIACANVANLTLMRGVRREQELVIRAALGAGASRLRRLLLVENLMLTVASSLLGLLIALGGLRMLTTFAARYSPRANEIGLDGVVLGFSLLLAVIVAVLLSFAPGLTSERTIGASLAAGGKRTTGTVRRNRFRQTLVIAQIAVSVVLLTGAGLLTRTMLHLSNVDAGLDAENVLTMEVPKDYNSASTSAVIAQYELIKSQLEALPSVSTVGIGSTMPLRASGITLDINAEGHPVAPGQAQPHSEYRTASPEYFSAAGIPLLEGRAFETTDRAETARVVILNKTLADQLFPGEDPIGRRVAWTGEVLKFIGVSGDWRTVVGVVGDTKDGGLDAAPIPATFIPYAQADFPSGGFVMRTRLDPSTLAAAATRIVREAAPDQPIENVLTVNQIRDESVAPRRLNAMLVSSFGILAMIVAAVGIAGVLAFSVSARTNEIGVRMSLGADSGRVQRMVLSEGGRLVLIGLVAGIIGALSLTRLMQGLLFGVPPHDPVTLGMVALIMAGVGIGACWIPAIRAARVEPAVALRAG